MKIREFLKDASWIFTVVAVLTVVIVVTLTLFDWMLEAIWG